MKSSFSSLSRFALIVLALVATTAANVPPQLHEFVFTFVGASPTAGDVLWGHSLPWETRILSIRCEVDPADSGESVEMTLQERDVNCDAPVPVDSTPIVALNGSTTDDLVLDNAVFAADACTSMLVGVVTGTVSRVRCTVRARR